MLLPLGGAARRWILAEIDAATKEDWHEDPSTYRFRAQSSGSRDARSRGRVLGRSGCRDQLAPRDRCGGRRTEYADRGGRERRNERQWRVVGRQRRWLGLYWCPCRRSRVAGEG